MSALLEKARNGEPLGIPGVVDMHGHLGRYRYPIADLSVDGVIAVMDRVGVERVVCSHMQVMSADPEDGNREVRDAMRAAPARILGYVAVFPSSPDQVRHCVEKWFAEGFSGLKFHNTNGHPYHAPAYTPAYEFANEHRLPILLHTWGRDEEFADVRAAAERFPELVLIMAHTGCSREDEYIRTARDCPNVYLDLTLSRSPRGLVQRLATSVGAERVVWGSDVYFFGQEHQLGKVLGADISDEDKITILARNPGRILDRIRR